MAQKQALEQSADLCGILKLTEPLDNLISEINECVGFIELMLSHIYGCDHQNTDIDRLFSPSLEVLKQRMADIVDKYNEGPLRDALLKAGGINA